MLLDKLETYIQLQRQLEQKIDEEIKLLRALLNQPIAPTPKANKNHRGKAILGRKRWSEQEDRQLVRLLTSGKKHNIVDICRVLKRTPRSIYCRTGVLRKKGIIPQNLTITGKIVWTPECVSRLIELHRSGLDEKAIAKELGFKVSSVTTKLNKLMRSGKL